MKSSHSVLWQTLRRWLIGFVGLCTVIWTTSVSAGTVSLSAEDVLALLRDARESNNPARRSVAKLLQQQLTEAGVNYVDGGLVFSGRIPEASKGVGKVYGGAWTAMLDSNATTFSFRLGPGNVGLDIILSGTVTAEASGALRREVTPSPFDPFPVPGWRHIDANASAQVKVTLSLDLDAMLSKGPDGVALVLGNRAVEQRMGPLSGALRVRADLDISSHDGFTGWWLEWVFDDLLLPLITREMEQMFPQLIEAKNQQIRTTIHGGQPLLPLKFRLPQVSDRRMRQLFGDALNIPIVGAILETHLYELLFYALTEDYAALQGLVCDVSRTVHARMTLPPLYTNVSGACTPANHESSGRFFADASCTREVSFQPTPYADYCDEVLRVQPNTQLGNANWVANTQQPNDPLPGVPSQSWTLSQGTRLAITTEPLNDKHIPIMKRFRFREIARPIPRVVSRYYGCVERAWGADSACTAEGFYDGPSPGSIPSPEFVGYVHKTQEPGTVPRYYACTLYWGGGDSGVCLAGNFYDGPAPDGTPARNFLGYVYKTPRPGMVARYKYSCVPSGDNGVCGPSGFYEGEAPGRSLPADFAGYVYPTSHHPSCRLEMRVYAKDLNATSLTPLLAFHGGSWQHRGIAFVVFVPFYRLAGQADGPPECNEATWSEVVADAEAALDWVKAHAAAFGARPGKIALMGQSSGAHLAGWLVTHRARDVAAGLLLYPPTDVSDLLKRYRSGEFNNDPTIDIERSLNILANFLGVDPRTLSLTDPIVQEHSFARLVAAMGASAPPVMLLHGHKDSLVPASQSAVLCEAYGGRLPTGTSLSTRTIVPCGSSGGSLHLFAQGQHGLDACINNGPCLAGDAASRQVIGDSLQQARTWLQTLKPPSPTTVSGEKNYSTATTGTTTLKVIISGAAPTGSVTFREGATVLGTVSLVSGTATFSVPSGLLRQGRHLITAEYSGDSNNTSSMTSLELNIYSVEWLPTVLKLILEE